MDEDLVFKEICNIIDGMPGVSVVDQSLSNEHSHIEFTVADPRSRLILVKVAEASNVQLHSWAQFDPSSKEAESDLENAILYRFNVSDKKPIDILKWLGAHLVWELFACKLISSQQELFYCDIFGTKSRNA